MFFIGFLFCTFPILILFAIELRARIERNINFNYESLMSNSLLEIKKK